MTSQKLLISTLLVIISSFISGFGQGDAPTQAPEAGFNLGSDISGSAISSVNLFTGEVAFPVNLVSLPGMNGISPSVTISYNSADVSRQTETWNRDAPTGILGLGWSMDFPRIIADHKQTGTRKDDDFYLFEGGTARKLILTRGTTLQHYATEEKLYWDITYDPALEEWKLITEDGRVMSYGNKNSGRNTVQWMVKWGNWIGSSIRPGNQAQMAHVWNLSSIENRIGDKMTFAYDAVLQYVGSSSGKQHTEASYLIEIKGPTGARINFAYAEKLAQEYMEPHKEKAEPDAYQEFYQKKYLQRITVHNEYDLKLNTINFEYEFLGSGDFTKRLLKEIVSEGHYGEQVPPIKFQYNSTGSHTGRLSQVTGPTGSTIKYTYNEVQLSLANRYKSITAPTGYGAPSVWQGNNFVVTGWRKLDAYGKAEKGSAPIIVQSHTWDGHWISKDVTMLNNISYESTAYL
ncbi:hypothetical protein LVD17_07380 [Fulvivirga ulvae]|uniref:hypothetical protein n=1 Tax=Fulvivirga ulvae TaxID=2904245 RepID=UPI001F407D73|nr:hypothetical protein [Fulvivirga ulvae]UII33640.1 hypothetical protein LVD17_07380 [Fulvivirga ulvae]